MEDNLIKFVRRKDYKLVRKLERGGFGETVLLHDPIIDEQLVCKKYSPLVEQDKVEFFANFIQEIKILYFINHPNVVRVFNYFLYPEHYTGYILMEHVKGKDLEDHLRTSPETLNSVFVQTIGGFAHLENNNVLHRDIRSQNILVGENASVKIIDFGFGKKVKTETDFDKSVSLNWPFTPPRELALGKYDFRTEVYFLGRLFESVIDDSQLDHFQYKSILQGMISIDPMKRIGSFNEIQTKISNSSFAEIDFENDEIQNYREFTGQLGNTLKKIDHSTKYIEDVDKIILRLEAIYQSVMLEEFTPNSAEIIRCFLNGGFRYITTNFIEVAALRAFLKLLRACDKTKRNIILRNLHSKFDSFERYSIVRDLDDEVPF